MTATPTCPECHGPVARKGATGPWPTYCSTPCRRKKGARVAAPKVAAKVRAIPNPCAFDGCDVDVRTTEGRKRKWCDGHRAEMKRRASRAATRSPGTRKCTKDGCDKPHCAKGLCSTHYNQTLATRHKPKTAACVVCDATIARSTGGGGRKFGATCSYDCRRILTHGDRCELPPDHWGRWYGRSSAWTVTTHECEWCGKNYLTPHPESLYCSDRCRNTTRERRRRAREYDAPGEYRWTQVVALWMALDQRCAYCLTHLPLTRMQVEHVVPLSRGGRNDRTNILPACGPCNAEKSDRTPNEWDADRIRLGLLPRTAHITHADARFAHLVPAEPKGIPYRLASSAA